MAHGWRNLANVYSSTRVADIGLLTWLEAWPLRMGTSQALVMATLTGPSCIASTMTPNGYLTSIAILCYVPWS